MINTNIFYLIQNTQNGKVLAPKMYSQTAKVDLLESPLYDSESEDKLIDRDSQLWAFIPTESPNTYYLINRVSGLGIAKKGDTWIQDNPMGVNNLQTFNDLSFPDTTYKIVPPTSKITGGNVPVETGPVIKISTSPLSTEKKTIQTVEYSLNIASTLTNLIPEVGPILSAGFSVIGDVLKIFEPTQSEILLEMFNALLEQIDLIVSEDVAKELRKKTITDAIGLFTSLKKDNLPDWSTQYLNAVKYNDLNTLEELYNKIEQIQEGYSKPLNTLTTSDTILHESFNVYLGAITEHLAVFKQQALVASQYQARDVSIAAWQNLARKATDYAKFIKDNYPSVQQLRLDYVQTVCTVIGGSGCGDFQQKVYSKPQWINWMRKANTFAREGKWDLAGQAVKDAFLQNQGYTLFDLYVVSMTNPEGLAKLMFGPLYSTTPLDCNGLKWEDVYTAPVKQWIDWLYLQSSENQDWRWYPDWVCHYLDHDTNFWTHSKGENWNKKSLPNYIDHVKNIHEIDYGRPYDIAKSFTELATYAKNQQDLLNIPMGIHTLVNSPTPNPEHPFFKVPLGPVVVNGKWASSLSAYGYNWNTLKSEKLLDPTEYTGFAGVQVLILEPSENQLKMGLNIFYKTTMNHQENRLVNYTQLLELINQSDYNKVGNIIVFKTHCFDLGFEKMDVTFQNLLTTAGAGTALDTWQNETHVTGSSLIGSCSYGMVGVIGSGTGQGVEVFSKTPDNYLVSAVLNTQVVANGSGFKIQNLS